MNSGNKQRERADGFLIAGIDSASTLKDPNGASILKLICVKLCPEDNSFHKIKSEFAVMKEAVKMPLGDLKQSC